MWKRKLKTIFIVIIGIVFIRIFVAQIITYDKSTMNPNVSNNNILIINKLAYGPRIPITCFSWPVNDEFIPFTSWHSYIDWCRLPYFRIFGYSSPQRGDVIAYNYPNYYDLSIDLRPIQISRIAALPKDTLLIQKKIVFVNSDTVYPKAPLLFHYRLELKAPSDTLPSKYKHHLLRQITRTAIDLSLTPAEALEIRQYGITKYIKPVITWKGYDSQWCFPKSEWYSWNTDYFGPVVIPFKGETLHLTIKNIALYKRLIENYEGNTITIDRQNTIFINGKKTDTYVVKNNYYFVLDDNRDHAKDSRFWGFLPESHIIGKVVGF